MVYCSKTVSVAQTTLCDQVRYMQLSKPLISLFPDIDVRHKTKDK